MTITIVVESKVGSAWHSIVLFLRENVIPKQENVTDRDGELQPISKGILLCLVHSPGAKIGGWRIWSLSMRSRGFCVTASPDFVRNMLGIKPSSTELTNCVWFARNQSHSAAGRKVMLVINHCHFQNSPVHIARQNAVLPLQGYSAKLSPGLNGCRRTFGKNF